MDIEKKEKISLKQKAEAGVAQSFDRNIEQESEQGVGQLPEMVDESAVRQKIEKQDELQQVPATSVPKPGTQDYKSDSYKIIENILEEDLGYIFEKLPPYLQKDFKKKGEQTTLEIEVLLKKVKVNIKKVIKLIVGWLRIIPGINKFYLEQEAKIKADKILLELHKK